MRKILIVDDDNDIIDLISVYLEDEFEPVSALNANDALKLAEKDHFDLFIVDIYLPIVNGSELIRQLSSKYQTPILAISGYLSREDFLDEALAMGASDFIEKPFMLGSFLKAVANLT